MNWLKNVRERVGEETSGVGTGVGSKREKTRIVGRLLGNAVTGAIHEAHDNVVLKQHDARMARVRSKSGYDSFAAAAGANDSEIAMTDALTVELLAAADLKPLKIADLKPYCKLVVGRPGASWGAKAAKAPPVTSPIAMRQRHPRWDAKCSVPFAPSIGDEDGGFELTVRVVSAHATREDTVLGEARVLFSEGIPSSMGTIRLLGGGFASLSLRWNLGGRHEAKRDRGAGFESALGFWAANAGSEMGVPQAFAAVLEACDGVSDGDAVNELVMMAPLAEVFARGTDTNPLFAAVAAKLEVLRPLSRSRLVGALTEKLDAEPGVVRGTEDDRRQRERTRAREETLLHSLFMTAKGTDLVELKRLVDTGGTGRDLRHIVFSGRVLTESFLHEALLQHFRDEAAELEVKPLLVLSDIDHTIWIGPFGEGGPKFPHGPIPGALSLYNALGGRITFLSARPPMWEGRTRGNLLDDMGIAEATVLPGTLQNVVRYVLPGQKDDAKKMMGEQKENVFLQFALLHPEARFVFCGDSGEGDIGFAVPFMDESAGGGDWGLDQKPQDLATFCQPTMRKDRAALIHDVVDSDGLRPRTSAQQRQTLREQGVIVFDTFLGAAVELYRLQFLDHAGLRRAVQTCVCEFFEISPGEFKSPAVCEARREEFERDLQLANQALREYGGLGRLSVFLDASELAELEESAPDPSLKFTPEARGSCDGPAGDDSKPGSDLGADAPPTSAPSVPYAARPFGSDAPLVLPHGLVEPSAVAGDDSDDDLGNPFV